MSVSFESAERAKFKLRSAKRKSRKYLGVKSTLSSASVLRLSGCGRIAFCYEERRDENGLWERIIGAQLPQCRNGCPE